MRCGRRGAETRLLFRALLVFAAILSSPVALAAECPTIGNEEPAAAEAVSGDALRFGDGSILRLAGIATPQSPFDLPAGTAWAPAHAAQQGLASIVAGHPLRIASTEEAPDRYGRRRGYVFLPDGRLLQALLVERGWAIARWLPEESLCFQLLLSA